MTSERTDLGLPVDVLVRKREHCLIFSQGPM